MKTQWFAYSDACVAVTERPGLQRSAPTLFLLHGRFCEPGMWDPLEARLAESYRVVTTHLPGFGRSFIANERGASLLEHASLLSEVVRSYSPGDDSVVLMAHDTGCALTQLIWPDLGKKLRALVWMSPASLARPLGTPNVGWFGTRMRWELDRIVHETDYLDNERRVALLASWSPGNRRRELVNALQALESSWPKHHERLHWKRALAHIQQPVLLLRGSKDPIHPADSVVEMMARLPEAELFEHPGCGHWPCLEDTDWVVEKVREFFFRIALPARRSA